MYRNTPISSEVENLLDEINGSIRDGIQAMLLSAILQSSYSSSSDKQQAIDIIKRKLNINDN